MRQKAEKLFRAVGEVGDDLIVRANEPVHKTTRVWPKWAALAACCALIIGAAALTLPQLTRTKETAEMTMDTAARSMDVPETAEASAAEYDADAYAQSPTTTDAQTPIELPESNAAPESDEVLISFTVDEASVTPTSATFVLSNDTGEVLTLSGGYRIEYPDGEEWVALTTRAKIGLDHSSSFTESYTLNADWSALYGELSPGQYRLVQPLTLADGTAYTAYAVFTVA